MVDENGNQKQLLGIIAGKAGTGKSKLIRTLKGYLKDELVLASQTGKAAKNIEGRTLHELFSLNSNTWEQTELSQGRRQTLQNWWENKR